MKNSKKWTALVLAAMMAASFTSCGGNSGSTGSTGGDASSAAASSEGSSEGGSEGSSEGGSEAVEAEELTLPLSEDTVTLTYFINTDGNASIVKTDYNDNEFFQELEKRTNVHIDWQMNSPADFQTNFNLMIASNQMTDIIYGAQYYTDGLDAAIDDGYFMDLTDLIPKYMPNYSALRNSEDRIRVATMTDSGRLPGVYSIMTEPQGPWMGLQIRKDWLDKVGMDVPVTFDDWTNVLTAFKDQLGVYAPLSLNGNGFTDLGRAMMSGFNVDYTWQLTGDGSVAYGPSLDGWREYITQMHDWYAAGLIDPDFMSANSFMVDMTMVITGKTGSWCSMYTMPSLYESSSEDKEMNIVPVASPRKQAGDEIHIRMKTNDIGGPTAISANCKNPEIALKWLDYLYSEEGAMLANYGVEGDTYTLNDSGEPVFTDKVLNNPDYSFSQAQASFLCPPSSIPNHYDWTRELGSVPEKDIASYDVWGSVKDDWVMPSLSLTSDEAVERAGIMTDIQTYAQEQTTAMITGIQDVETYWDTYVETMKSMNLDRAVEITQAAYDRYLNR